MGDLRFTCLDAAPQRYGASPTLLFRLRVSGAEADQVHAIALRCQIRIEPRRRTYSDAEAGLLAGVFGDRSRWGDTLTPLQLATVSVLVPGFTGSTEVEVPVPCSYDLEVAAGSYLHALSDGGIPMLLLFSGTVFGKGEQGFWIEQIPWHAEATHLMPVTVWHELMDTYFPNSGWIRLSRDVLDDLQRYKAAHAIPSWDELVAGLVPRGERAVR
ncbi:MAG: DUF6084 family protein [Actinocatenispora sp.]